MITHLPSKIVGQAGERRSQHENREVAVDRLRLNLAIGLRNPVASEQLPSELWRSRVLLEKDSDQPAACRFPDLDRRSHGFCRGLRFRCFASRHRTTIAVNSKSPAVRSNRVKIRYPLPAFSWLNQNREKFDLADSLNRLAIDRKPANALQANPFHQKISRKFGGQKFFFLNSRTFIREMYLMGKVGNPAPRA